MGLDAISVVILAAGESQRMGQPKPLLPWGWTTILGQVVATFSMAGLSEIVVVTGGAHESVERLVVELADKYPLHAVFNPDHIQGGMLSSIKVGLTALHPKAQAAMIALGDQPQVHLETVTNICNAFLETGSPLIVPSFKNQRGHPWLAGRLLWAEILALPGSVTPRHFLRSHASQVKYIPADHSILQDLDTPEDYTRSRP
jgi:molybdenum cofactor cytidylyltransferase